MSCRLVLSLCAALGVALAAAPADAQSRRAEAPALTLDFSGAALAQGVRAGGSDRVSVTGSGCSGFIASATPTAAVRADAPGPFSIWATSSTDLTLVVADPDGQWHCSDDARGTDPAVTFARPKRGTYLVWVGTFSAAAAGAQAQLHVGPGAPRW
ncbi:MAG: hypothetical protein ACK41D_11155 [Rubricoccaceae bacterium]